jgi:hypothetical protein
MKKSCLLSAVFLAAGCASAPELAPPPFAAPDVPASQASQWIELGADGAAELRVVTDDATCPKFPLQGGGELQLGPRAPRDDKFALVCSALLPRNARIAGLPAINPTPRRILVLGDTGCRLKGAAIQNCNNPSEWPFPNVAAAAARLKPDLVIHLGDYQYRESPCPPGNQGCAGTPYGDNWPAWKADFFAPAAPLLSTAPWIFVRGNHETCDRSGPGYLKMLGPHVYAPNCVDHQAPYRVRLGDFSLMVMDDADADDLAVNPAHVPVYQAELEDAVRPSPGPANPTPVWLVLHRPIWGTSTGPLGIPAGGNAQIIAAAERTMVTKPVTLMLAGHLHTFEAINYSRGGADGTPPSQIVAGNGGDALLVTPANLKGTAFQGHSGVAVKDGLSVGGFGFLLMTKGADGWTIDLYDAGGVAEGQCKFSFASGRVDCPKLPGKRAAN